MCRQQLATEGVISQQESWLYDELALVAFYRFTYCTKLPRALRLLLICQTQSIMYVPLQINRFQTNILLIVQYKYVKSCSRDFYSPESDPPHKIMRYWFLFLNLVGGFISTRPRWSGENVLYHNCTSFEGASRGGQPFNIFTWFIGAGSSSWNNYHHFSRFWDQLYGPFGLGLFTEMHMFTRFHICFNWRISNFSGCYSQPKKLEN